MRRHLATFVAFVAFISASICGTDPWLWWRVVTIPGYTRITLNVSTVTSFEGRRRNYFEITGQIDSGTRLTLVSPDRPVDQMTIYWNGEQRGLGVGDHDVHAISGRFIESPPPTIYWAPCLTLLSIVAALVAYARNELVGFKWS
jgi:hypothetical protein